MKNIIDIKTTIERHITKRINDNYMLGAIWGVWDRENKLCGTSYGSSNISKTKPILENTVFRLASMTKPILGCAIMQLYEKGIIDLDEPITQWFPSFSSMMVASEVISNKIISVTPADKVITPRMLLTHSSGLGSGKTYDMQSIHIKKTGSLQESVENYSESILDFQPGCGREYSPIWAMDVLAGIVEIVTGKNYEDYIKENIFIPLDMHDTTYKPEGKQLTRIVDFVKRTDGGFELCDIDPQAGFISFGPGYVSGGAGLFSTIEDYSHFALMLLNNGTYRERQILSPKSVDMMATPQLSGEVPGFNELYDWGLSVQVRKKQSGEQQPLTAGSFGWSGAFGTHFWIDREEGIAAIYMMNLADAQGSGEPASLEFERDVYI